VPTQAVLAIGVDELLGNPTNYLIEPSGPMPVKRTSVLTSFLRNSAKRLSLQNFVLTTKTNSIRSRKLFSPGTPASSTTNTGHHDIAEISLKVTLNTKNQIKSF
jgi:hypothetical protein